MDGQSLKIGSSEGECRALKRSPGAPWTVTTPWGGWRFYGTSEECRYLICADINRARERTDKAGRAVIISVEWLRP